MNCILTTLCELLLAAQKGKFFVDSAILSYRCVLLSLQKKQVACVLWVFSSLHETDVMAAYGAAAVNIGLT